MGWILRQKGNILHFCIAMSFLAFYFTVLSDFQVYCENSTANSYPASPHVNYFCNHSAILKATKLTSVEHYSLQNLLKMEYLLAHEFITFCICVDYL